ncbi:MAG: hypothetical protein U1F54_04375 [Burkholderiales bacterium]
MNLRHALIATAALVLAASARAHDCSGGTDGGMDATGNQCNEPARVVAAAPAPAKSEAVRSVNASARPAKTAAGTPNGSERLAHATGHGR